MGPSEMIPMAVITLALASIAVPWILREGERQPVSEVLELEDAAASGAAASGEWPELPEPLHCPETDRPLERGASGESTTLCWSTTWRRRALRLPPPTEWSPPRPKR